MCEINTLGELQSIEDHILKQIHSYCMKNNIQYFLGYGSLLGAVRHQGFIPWDDDIDILMPRPDYEKFLQLSKEKEISKTIKVISIHTDKDYYLPFAKVIDRRTELIEENIRFKKKIGVFVDVFPIDGLPDNTIKKMIYIMIMKLYQYILQLSSCECVKSKNKVKKIIGKIVKPFFKLINLISPILTPRCLITRMEKLVSKYSYSKANNVGVIVWGHGKKEVMKKSVFKETKRVVFNGDFYNAPVGYNQYLERIYGNYMALPPKEERVAKHQLNARWKC